MASTHSSGDNCPTCGKAGYKDIGWRKYLTLKGGKRITFYSNVSRTLDPNVSMTNIRIPDDIKLDDLEAIMLLIEIEHRTDPFFRWGVLKEDIIKRIIG